MTITAAVEESRIALREALIGLEDALRKSGSWAVYEVPFNAVRLRASELIERTSK